MNRDEFRLAGLAALALTLALVPGLARADASIIQTLCHTPDNHPNIVEVYFQVVNYSLPEPVCGLRLRSEPFPPPAACEPRRVGDLPAGWGGDLNDLGGADYWAADDGACIGQLDISGEFIIVLPEPDLTFCCFVVDFLNAAGEVMLTQEECFYCTTVPTEAKTWGTIKGLYR